MFSLDAFATRLKGIRIELCLSQGALAHRLGISRVALSYYENGQRTPDVAFLQALHEATGYPYDYLMGAADVKETKNIDLSKATGLNDAALKLVKEYAPDLNQLAGHDPGNIEALLDFMSPDTWADLFNLALSSNPENRANVINWIGTFIDWYETSASDLLSECQLIAYRGLSGEARRAIHERIAQLKKDADDSSDSLRLYEGVSGMMNRINLTHLPLETRRGISHIESLEKEYRNGRP